MQTSWQAVYPEWQAVIEDLVQASGAVMVLGGVDTGKSTFCSLLLRQWQRAGALVGYLDLDPGQSNVGPPATFSWTLVRQPFERLSELSPGGLAFLGDTTPARHLSLALTGARRVLDELLALQPEKVVIDTCGYVGGWIARHYKLTLADLLRPRVIVGLQRERELMPILNALSRRADWRVEVLPVPEAIARKPPIFRTQYRRVAFARYFEGARSHTLPLNQVSLIGRRLGAGEPLSEAAKRHLENQIRAELLHAERYGDHLHVILRQPLTEQQIGLLQTLTRANRLTLLPPSAYQYLLVGLTDYTGRTFGAGLIESLNFEAGTLTLLSPVHSVQPVRWVQLGYLRVLPDGTELGEPLREG
ncbi:MAG: Clp1/GlmU family protein [Fimbriimonadales bacterium]|nr:Clp1/GlmU family protein [Fimbriimonadales bacterium]